MKIFDFLKEESKIFVLGIIAIILLASTIGVVSSVDCEEHKDKCTGISRIGGHYENL